jgi:hypothetical protein
MYMYVYRKTHPAPNMTKELAIHNELTRMSWLQSSTTALNVKVTQTKNRKTNFKTYTTRTIIFGTHTCRYSQM